MKNVNDRIDELEAELLENFVSVDCPLKHRFVPGMYIREIFMKKGMVITSLVHKTIHPFFILKGKVTVFTENNGVQVLEAPHTGITYPGTRRVLRIEQDCVWATCHITDIRPKDATEESIQEAVALIRDQIIEPHENKLLGGIFKNNVLKKA